MPAPPAHWEADVILNDGGIATLRPIRPDDREGIIDFYTRVSPKSKYLRFFSTHPTLSEEDLRQWIDIDYHDAVTLVLVERDKIVATARYEVVSDRVADVSFLVQDDHHGRGAGNILLEHLAQIGRECGIERFFAETLTENRSMIQVFIRAGYEVKPQLEDGFIVVDFPIESSATSREVMQRRELRAEASSISRLLSPQSVAVIGDSTQLQHVVPHLVSAGFRGQLYTAPDLASITSDVDVVLAPRQSTEILRQAAQKNAVGVVFLAQGRNPQLRPDEAVEFVHQARAHGLRTLGPAALGIINTDPEIQLNASPAPTPRRGELGIFTQSAGIATLALSHALQRNCGISNFIAAGAFADVTGNDVIQFWANDPRTKICLLSLDVIGNPRKFFRVLRRLALEKHVVVFLPSRALKSARHYEIEGLSTASPDALDKVIRETGAMVTTRRDAMYDIAEFLSKQPVPTGRRIAVISNSAGLTAQMQQSAERFGFSPTAITVTGDPLGIIAETEKQLENPAIDLVFPAVVEITEPITPIIWEKISQLASTTPLMLAAIGFDQFQPTQPGNIPLYRSYADALEAVAAILNNEQLRMTARPHPDDEWGSGDTESVEKLIADITAQSPAGRWATDTETTQILAAYGLDLVPWQAVSTFDQAVAAADSFGWDVVLKSTHPMVRGRPELNAVIRNIVNREMLEQAWQSLQTLAESLSLDDCLPVIQPTVKPGASLSVRAIEDPVLGPMVSVGVAGIPTELLNDLSWRVPPLRRIDARSMLDGLGAAPLLHGYRGAKPTRLDTLEQVLMNIAQLKDDFAAIVDIELSPVIAGITETSIVGAKLRIAPLDSQRDPLARSL